MVKKGLILAVAIVFCAASFAMAADEAKKVTPIKSVVPGTATAKTVRQAPKPEFSMIAGKVESIDSSDPKNVKITVKNDKDGTSRTLTVMPWTNITKSVEISELKAGEPVRVMARKAQDKEIAMGIMFGKMTVAPHKQVPAAQAAATKTKVPVKK